MADKKKVDDSGEETKKSLGSKELLGSLLKEHKKFHYQNLTTQDYKVSTGSLKLDRKLQGGLPPGVHRFVGITEGGKSSEALEVIRNFLLTPKRKAIYVKAEGRLSPEVRARSGIKFVFTEEEWEEGTCFVFKCNVFETMGTFIRALVLDNPEKITYGFVIDSMDALMKKSDLEKELEESEKVAAAAVMTSSFMKRLNLPICEAGHLCILISQVRSKVQIEQGGPKEASRLGNFSGGNAALHYANFIFEFQERWDKDYIYEFPEIKEREKRGRIFGKLVKINIVKSSNETTHETISYPIKNGRINGTSIWVEREIVEELILRNAIIKNASWFSTVDFLMEELKKNGFGDFPAKTQGIQSLYDYIETRPDLRDFLYHYLTS